MPNTALKRKFEQTKISNYYETCKKEYIFASLKGKNYIEIRYG